MKYNFSMSLSPRQGSPDHHSYLVWLSSFTKAEENSENKLDESHLSVAYSAAEGKIKVIK